MTQTQLTELDVIPTHEEHLAIATITVAFSSDPVARWVFKDADRYLTYWPRLTRAAGGGAFTAGTADSIGEGDGVALWLPPGVAPDEEAMGAILREALSSGDTDEVFGFLGQMDEFHPTEPHWYLPMVGVDVTRRSRGCGSALLRHGLARCDRDRLPAYLEATSPLNRSLYLRHGFEELGVIQAGGSPPMWPMLRRATRSTIGA